MSDDVNIELRYRVSIALDELKAALDKSDKSINVVRGFFSENQSIASGHSEHNLGLALDIKSDDYESDLDLLLSIKDLAHLYGFIIEEVKSDDDCLEYGVHIRYIGKESSIDMYEKNIKILEEYIDKFTNQ